MKNVFIEIDRSFLVNLKEIYSVERITTETPGGIHQLIVTLKSGKELYSSSTNGFQICNEYIRLKKCLDI